VNRADIDAETAERMLHGEQLGPRELAGLLAAVAAEPAAEELVGEQAAVAAFHQARMLSSQPPPTRRSTTACVRAALIGFLLLLLASGVAMVAASHRLPGPIGGKHSAPAHRPARSGTLQRAPSPLPERPQSTFPPPPGAPSGSPTPTPPGAGSTDSSQPPTSGLPIPSPVPTLPDATKKAKGKASKIPPVKVSRPKVAVSRSTHKPRLSRTS
jgi:hypothetical protein